MNVKSIVVISFVSGVLMTYIVFSMQHDATQQFLNNNNLSHADNLTAVVPVEQTHSNFDNQTKTYHDMAGVEVSDKSQEKLHSTIVADVLNLEYMKTLTLGDLSIRLNLLTSQ